MYPTSIRATAITVAVELPSRAFYQAGLAGTEICDSDRLFSGRGWPVEVSRQSMVIRDTVSGPEGVSVAVMTALVADDLAEMSYRTEVGRARAVTSKCQNRAMANREDERRERALAIGPPVYGLAGQRPLDEFGSSRTNSETTALLLYFGTKGRPQRLGVQTTTEAVDDFAMLIQLVMLVHDKHSYPLTIEERTASVEIDAVIVRFRILAVADDLWCGAAPVGDRWVFLRGEGVPPGGVRIEPINFADL